MAPAEDMESTYLYARARIRGLRHTCVCTHTSRRGMGVECDDMEIVYPELGEYVEYLKAHGRKDSTVETVIWTVRRVLTFLEEGGRATAVDDLTADDAVWLYKNLPVSEGVRREYINSLNRMCLCLRGKDIVKPADLLWNRESHVNRAFISVEEFGLMYRAADPAMRVALALGAFMGLRRAEICSVKEEDVKGRKLTVHGKGHGPDGFVSVMEMPEPVLEAIREFREFRSTRGKDSGDGFIFQLLDGRGVWHGVHPVTLGRKVSELGESVGVDATTHSLRRLYATTLANDVKADLNTVRLLLRHADVSTTVKCYIDPDPRELRRASGRLSDVLEAVVSN